MVLSTSPMSSRAGATASARPDLSGLPGPGESIAGGKYQIERLIGCGGMGAVLVATHRQLGERVAIKFLLPGALQSGEALDRFLREARAAVSLKNEHVVRILDVDTLPSGLPYMVMEYLTGADLGEVLELCGPLPVPEALDYVACER
jgi:serine/threonine-protein kinase